tara:strand:+ start:179 stop:370 length:192 start_codon:yes stop_codon:yes gene_type:complete
MKKITVLLIFLFLANCTLPKQPGIMFGKKCLVDGKQVTYSYVWIYDKSLDNKPDQEQCKLIEE